ncbi:signal peptidase I [Nocardioides sp. AX2bis]|uniref:signal peptidase I n=1 Tax=Nocardioides sp. AX2bis TaxID=2653157 RepID=UPI001F23CC3B|nr:signal peptidase I [Nocardioides sp. AX2bis]
MVTPVRIDSASMAPTLEAGDVVLVSRWAPEVEDLAHGDLVVFVDPRQGRRTIKRVVGLPGEAVVVLDGVLHVDGAPVEEPWVDPATVDGYYSRTFEVPDHHVFVLGDNRGNSVDSRDYGAVDEEALTGRVLLGS